MAVNRIAPQFAYGMGDNLLQLAPRPISSVRAPTTDDLAQIGTIWVDTTAGVFYGLASIAVGSATWTSTPAAGATILTELDITGVGGLDVQNAGSTTIISSSTINFDNGAATTTISGALSVAGTFTMTGDLDLTSAALIDLTSTLDAAPSILLRANGGVSEQIRIHSDQGTSVNSIELDSDDGGITLVSGLASDDAINLTANSGGIDIDAGLQINITSAENAADAIVIVASAGGIDITAIGAPAEDIDIVNTAGSININSGEVIANSMVLTSAGGLDFTVAGTGSLDIDMVNTAGSINISSAEAVADAIVIAATDAAGGVQIQAGTGGILIGNEADTTPIDMGNFAPTASRTITVGGGTVVTAAVTDTIDIAPDGATTNANSIKVVNIATGVVTTGENNINIGTGTAASGTHAVNISTNTGGGTKTVNIGNADGLTTFNVDAITLINDSLNVNTSINTGTSTGVVAIGNGAAGAVTVDSGAGISLDGATASNFTVTGATQDLTLSSVGGSVLVLATEDIAQNIYLHSDGGVSDTLHLHSDQGTGVTSVNIASDDGGITLNAGLASVNAIVITASNAAGGLDIDSGTGGITMDSTSAISLDSATAGNFTVADAGADLTLASTLGRVVINGEEAAVEAVRIFSAAGGVDLDAALSVTITSSENTADSIVVESSAGGIDILASGAVAGEDIDIIATGSSVNVTSSEAIVDAIVLSASAGGVDIDGALQVNIASSENAVDSIVIQSSAGGIDILASGAGAGEDIDITATGSSVNITSTEAIADAIVLSASNAAGGIDISTGGGEVTIASSGNVTMQPVTASVAGTSLTANGRVFVCTFTGQTTGAAANLDLTITNSSLGAGDGIFLTVSNLGSNDADMTLEGVITQTGGTILVHTQNNGAAALNGDIVVTGWIIN